MKVTPINPHADGEMYEVVAADGNWWTAYRLQPDHDWFLVSKNGRNVKRSGVVGKEIVKAIDVYLAGRPQ